MAHLGCRCAISIALRSGLCTNLSCSVLESRHKGLLGQHSDQGIHTVTIEFLRCEPRKNRYDLLRLKTRTVGPVFRQGTIHIGHRDNARFERQIWCHQPIRISRPIELFMVLSSDNRHLLESCYSFENLSCELRVLIDSVPLRFIELCRLVQYRIGETQLANVMQQRCTADQLYAVDWQPHLSCNSIGGICHSDGVAKSKMGLRVNDFSKGLADLIDLPIPQCVLPAGVEIKHGAPGVFLGYRWKTVCPKNSTTVERHRHAYEFRIKPGAAMLPQAGNSGRNSSFSGKDIQMPGYCADPRKQRDLITP